VVDEIGVGGMASVHLARVDGPGGFQKWVAIKRIHPHLVEDDQFVDMFLDEARIAAGINHANVAQVFDLGKDDNTYWIAMEYLHGEPLREMMRRLDEQGIIIPWYLAARICADAAEGLHGAHELRGRNGQLLGLVHRDVTPHNLFVTYEGNTKVVDFGIAKVVDRLASTRAGTLKGKLAYMSPEQVRGQDVDRRTDIFALGVVLWELTTNRRLFRMDTDLDTLEKVQACIVPPPSTIIQGYPRDLEEVVMHALAQRREDRYQTGREFSRALQGFLMRHGTLCGPEEVGEFMKRMFGDRVEKREKYLEWAAEVTSSVDIAALRAEGGAPSTGMGSEPEPSHSQAQAPAMPPPVPPSARQQAGPGGYGPPMGAGGPGQPQPHHPPHQGPPAVQRGPLPPQGALPPPAARRPPPPGAQPQPQPPAAQPVPDLAQTSLMDEDEDIPTRVASRDESALIAAAQAQGGQGGRPPAGRPEHDLERTTAAPDWPGMSPGQGPGGPPARPKPAQAEDDEEFNATIALGDDKQAAAIRQEIAAIEQQRANMPQAAQNPMAAPPGYGQAPPGQGAYGNPQQPYGQQPMGGQQMPYGQQPQMGPGGQQGMAGMQPQAAPYDPNAAAAAAAAAAAQSNIETKMSMPRPAAVTQWIAEQGALEMPGPRSTPVLMAIALLATLCVIGVGALVAYKIRVGDQPASMAQGTGAPSMTHDPLAPENGASADSTSGSGEDPKKAGTAKTSDKGSKAAPSGSAASGSGPAPNGEAAAGDNGFLTVFCNPACDQIIAGGRSLGASPVTNVSMPPGQVRVTLKRSGGPTKVVSVIIVSGQVTTQNITMK